MVLQATFLEIEDNEKDESMGYFNKNMELYEIYNYITISQHLHIQSRLSNKLGLPPLHQSQDPLTFLWQLDACLEKWDSRLTPALRYDNSRRDVKSFSYRQAVYLRMR